MAPSLRRASLAPTAASRPSLPSPEHNNDNNIRKPAPVARQEGLPLTARHLFKTLQWGLIVFCLVFSIVGGVAAERVLDVLHCQPDANPALRSCSWLANPIGLRLTPFLSAGGMVDYPFVLLSNFWGLLLAWGLALYAARWADHNPAAATALLQRWLPRKGHATSADFLRWGVGCTFWLLLAGFIGFCLALGLPIVGNQTARAILESLGCSPGTFDPFSSPCMRAPGFWTSRLSLYVIPLAGPLLAPVWLVMGFWDVLLGWMVLIGTTFALKSHLPLQVKPQAHHPHPSAETPRRP
ncbi:hypothetical protein CLU85_3123 [Acidovorax sp. 69]|uniref:hypothetical protein n=1 Tax=Acidovorax sp. 69 TaxID=2035202 RepID=UPI000CBB4C85|nr:hypothetical protein [Acidovorax sp. 69]PJI98303.1 hypothetical protein CLU85_3123 [Acidovorax sp. 69]